MLGASEIGESLGAQGYWLRPTKNLINYEPWFCVKIWLEGRLQHDSHILLYKEQFTYKYNQLKGLYLNSFTKELQEFFESKKQKFTWNTINSFLSLSSTETFFFLNKISSIFFKLRGAN